MHSALLASREELKKGYPYVRSICEVHPALHHTLGIILNRRSGIHKDSKDGSAWAVMFVLGDFSGGEIMMSKGDFSKDGEATVVTTPFQPGDAIIFDAQTTYHAIKVWHGCVRVTLVYYTGASVLEINNKS